MATTLKQFEANDIKLNSDGTTFAIATGKEAYGNIIADTIRTLRGEIQLNTSIGIPYQTTVWASTSKVEQWKDEVRQVVEAFAFVDDINSFSAAFKKDDKGLMYLTYRLEVLLTTSEVVVIEA